MINTPSSEPTFLRGQVDEAEEAKLYYKAHAFLFFFGGVCMYAVSGVAMLLWEHMWSGIATIFIGGACWILGVLALKSEDRAKRTLRYYSLMGYETSEDHSAH